VNQIVIKKKKEEGKIKIKETGLVKK